MRFPEGFVWGAATAAHQVEGGNWNNDWWAWEQDPDAGCAEPSGDAIDHHHRFDDDIRLLASLGFDNYRFFLEAAREDDFLGVQTYSRTRVGPDGTLGPEPGRKVLPMGYEYWPEGLEA